MARLEFPPREALYPVPVVLVSCANKDSSDIITIAWCGVVCSKPPLLSVSIRPSRYSHSIIKDAGDFVINIPSQDLVKESDICGTVSGADKDKFKLCSFTKIPSSKISSPMIKECPVNIECKLKNIMALGAHDMFIGEVMAVHADESVLDKDGKIDFKKTRPFTYNQGEYWSLGERLGYHGFSSKI